MAMPTHEREAHVRRDAQALIDQPPGLHAPRGADGAEPVDVVLEREEAAGGDEGGEHVVVLGHGVGLGRVGVEVLAEPDVLAHDLPRRLDVLALAVLVVRDAPARRPARPGLLRQRQRDAVRQRADDEGALAVARAPRRAEALGVDARLVGAELLEPVDHAVDPPGPGRQRAGGVRVAEERVERALPARAAGGLGGELVVVEADGADGTGDRQGRSADGDDGRAWGGAGLLDGGADRHGLRADGDLHGHGAS